MNFLTPGEYMDQQKPKHGLSVQELENMGKKYKFEICFILYFIVAAIFAGTIFNSYLSILLAALGGILGVFLPKKADSIMKSLFGFVFKQEKITMMVLAACGLVVAFFLPFVIFFLLGFSGGSSIYSTARGSGGSNLPPA